MKYYLTFAFKISLDVVIVIMIIINIYCYANIGKEKINLTTRLIDTGLSNQYTFTERLYGLNRLLFLQLISALPFS